MVRIGNTQSRDSSINIGMPQGSYLGPILFICCINRSLSSKLEKQNCNIISYANDTTLIFYGDTWEETFHAAQEGFHTVSHWFTLNKLTLNPLKRNILHSQSTIEKLTTQI